MEINFLNAFFFLNETVLNIKAFFEKDKVIYISILYLNVYGIYMCSNAILDGILIPINVIGVLLGLVFTYLIAVTCVYHFKKDDVFKRYREWKSNQNLSTTIKTSKTFNKTPNKDFSALIADHKDSINKCFSGIRRIGLVHDDVSQSDFENLIANCFIESETSFTFKLEVNSASTSGFIRELFIPILEKIDKNNSVTKKKIASFLYFKKDKGYVKFKESAIKSKSCRVSISATQRQLYDTLIEKM